MASRTTYWPEALGGPEDGKLFSFRTCDYYIYLDANQHLKKSIAYTADARRELKKPANSLKSGVGYELDLAPQGDRTARFFILDIDYHAKTAQRAEIRSNRALVEYLSEQDDLYVEYTVNGGIHVLFKCSEPIYISDSMSKCPLTIATASGAERNGVVFEFKQKCLVYPSAFYVPLRSAPPRPPLVAHAYDVITSILDCIQDCFPNTCRVEWANHLGLHRLPSQRALAVFNTTINAAASSSKSNPRSLSDLMQNEHDDEDDDRATLDDKMQKVFREEEGEDNSAPGGKRRQTEDTVLGGGGDDDDGDNDEEDLEPIAIDALSKKRQAPAQQMPIVPSAKRRRKAGNSGAGACIKQIALANLKQYESNGANVPQHIIESYTQDECEPDEYLANVVYKKQVQEVVDNIKAQNPNVANVESKITYMNALLSSLNKFHCYINKKALNDKARIYGENVKMFLQYLQLADRGVDASRLFTDGIYSPMVATDPWMRWLYHYCHMMICLEQLHHARSAGRNSRITQFQDYALYREITKRNSCGYNMSEDAAYAEYRKVRSMTSESVAEKFVNCWYKFESFVLKTLAVILINVQVVGYFVTYVDYICSSEQELDLYLDMLLFIKLHSFDFKLEFLYEEMEYGKIEPLAVVYFHNHHWLPANTDKFRCFVQKCFPNLPHQQVDTLIKYLSNQDRSTSYFSENQRAVKFKCWKNMIPFQNGILDFNYVKTIIDEIDKREASKNKTERYCEFTLASKHDYVADRSASVSARLKSDELLRKRLTHEFDIPLETVDLDRYTTFSTFRNYTHTDAVMSPLAKSLAIDDYTVDFDTTALLSLTNYTRYSEEFCTYTQCLFGTNAVDGFMGPFQYVRMLITYVFLAQSLLRNKIFQASLNLIGNGSNGKSQFMDFLNTILGDKMVYITTKSFFNTVGETRQMSMVDEEVFLVYDVEANDVDMAGFKTFVTDTLPQLCRKLYKGLDRNRKNFASVVMCSNTPIRYITSSHSYLYDEAFHRRVIVLPLYNVLGRKPRKRLYEQDLSIDSESDDDCAEQQSSAKKPRIVEEESLFKRKSYNIKNEQTVNCIRRGIFFYLLDIIHVFDLAGLSATNNDYIQTSLANQRILGAANNAFASVLFDKYCVLDQIYTRPGDIYNQQAPPVDLAVFFYENMHASKLNGVSLDSVCNFLDSCFGVQITKTQTPAYGSLINISPDDGSSSIPASQKSTNPWATEIGKYMASGLLLKKELHGNQEAIFKQPNQNYKPGKEPRNLDNSRQLERFVFENVPIGHRFIFNDPKFKHHFLKIVYKLCKEINVDALQKPLKTLKWVHVETSDLIK